MSQYRALRILLIDEDRNFASDLNDRLRSQNVQLDWRSSLSDLGSIGKLGAYDLIVVEPLIRPVNGLEIAEYVDTFFPGLPVLLFAKHDLPESVCFLPKSVTGFVRKEFDLDGIVAEILQHCVAYRDTIHHLPKSAQQSRYASA